MLFTIPQSKTIKSFLLTIGLTLVFVSFYYFKIKLIFRHNEELRMHVFAIISYIYIPVPFCFYLYYKSRTALLLFCVLLGAYWIGYKFFLDIPYITGQDIKEYIKEYYGSYKFYIEQILNPSVLSLSALPILLKKYKIILPSILFGFIGDGFMRFLPLFPLMDFHMAYLYEVIFAMLFNLFFLIIFFLLENNYDNKLLLKINLSISKKEFLIILPLFSYFIVYNITALYDILSNTNEFLIEKILSIKTVICAVFILIILLKLLIQIVRRRYPRRSVLT